MANTGDCHTIRTDESGPYAHLVKARRRDTGVRADGVQQCEQQGRVHRLLAL